jgi:hypothetical protein
MYGHAFVKRPTELSRSDWRVICYRVVQAQAKGEPVTIDGPEWLRQEVKRFRPDKWIAYWNKKTGRISREQRLIYSAKDLIRLFGPNTLSEARSRVVQAHNKRMASHWREVARMVAKMGSQQAA